MADLSKSFLQDLFNVPRNGTVVDDEDEDLANNAESSVPFDEKAKGIADTITKIPPTPVVSQKEVMSESSEPVKPAIVPPKVDEVIKKVTEETAATHPTAGGFDDIFADVKTPVSLKPAKPDPKVDPRPQGVVVPATVSVASLSATVIPVDKIKAAVEKATAAVAATPVHVSIEPPVVAEKIVEVAITNESNVDNTPDEVNGLSKRWLLKSPSAQYSLFYIEKLSLLTNELLKDGEIPFDAYYKELEAANVDVNVPTYDAEEVGRRISEVMNWRDRIKHIQLHVNAQYFVWKQFMELLPGVIARIEYERGKQEGIVYEHMKDMYGYYGSLEGLHKSCEAVSKHLDAAYTSLSRQVTITQPQNEYERFLGGPKPMAPSQRNFDSLNSGGGAAGTLKEVAKATEPKPKKSVWEKLN